MDCSRYNRLNHPFSQTQLIEMVMRQVQCVKKQGLRFSLQFTQCKVEAASNLPALKASHYLSIRLTHLQMSQSTETVKLSKLAM